MVMFPSGFRVFIIENVAFNWFMFRFLADSFIAFQSTQLAMKLCVRTPKSKITFKSCLSKWK